MWFYRQSSKQKTQNTQARNLIQTKKSYSINDEREGIKDGGWCLCPDGTTALVQVDANHKINCTGPGARVSPVYKGAPDGDDDNTHN